MRRSAWDGRRMNEDEKLVRIYRAGNSIEGSFLQGLLADEGIPAALTDGAGRRVVSANAAGEIDVHVPTEHRGAAEEIIRDYERRSAGEDAGDGGAWECLRCGEENESSFDACWNCQANHGNA